MNALKTTPFLAIALLLAACAPRHARSPATMLPQPVQEDEPPFLVADGEKILRIERHRPLKPADQYDIESHSVFDAQIKMPPALALFVTKGSRLESGVKHYDVAGRVAVVAMDDSGIPSAFTFTVKTCSGADKEILPPGTVLDAQSTPTGMTYTRRDGVKVTRDATQALLGLFNQEKGAGSPPRGRDKSPIPHKIGDTWPVEVPPTVTRGVGEGSKAAFTDAHAWTTLKSLKTLAGIPAVEVESGFEAILHFDSLPFGFHAKPAEFHATQTLLYPLNSALPPLQANRHMDTEVFVDGNFLLMPVSADVKVSMDQTITPVLPPASGK